MKIVNITYTTQVDFAPQNKNNIEKVMNDLQQLNVPGIRYSAFVHADGKTFTHLAHFREEADQKILFDLASFKSFQEQLKASMPEVPPRPEAFTLIGSSHEIFGN